MQLSQAIMKQQEPSVLARFLASFQTLQPFKAGAFLLL